MAEEPRPFRVGDRYRSRTQPGVVFEITVVNAGGTGGRGGYHYADTSGRLLFRNTSFGRGGLSPDFWAYLPADLVLPEGF